MIPPILLPPWYDALYLVLQSLAAAAGLIYTWSLGPRKPSFRAEAILLLCLWPLYILMFASEGVSYLRRLSTRDNKKA